MSDGGRAAPCGDIDLHPVRRMAARAAGLRENGIRKWFDLARRTPGAWT